MTTYHPTAPNQGASTSSATEAQGQICDSAPLNSSHQQNEATNQGGEDWRAAFQREMAKEKSRQAMYKGIIVIMCTTVAVLAVATVIWGFWLQLGG